MSITEILDTPWIQPLVALIITITGSLLGQRTANPSAGVSALATTSGANSPVTQHVRHTTTNNTWNIQAPTSFQRSQSQASVDDDDDVWAKIIVTFVLIVGSIMLLAAYWRPFTVALYATTALAMFVNSFAWRRWDPSLPGRHWMAALLFACGLALLWGVSMFPHPLGSVPGLHQIAGATVGQSWSTAMATTWHLIQGPGLLVYVARLVGLTILVTALVSLTSKSLVAALASTATRSAPPRPWMLRWGNRLAGPRPVDFSLFLSTVVMVLVGLAALHPWTLAWLLDHLPLF